jgi:hypothetical protein
MKILSWDIGIKNLPICILDITPKNPDATLIRDKFNLNIEKWELINLIEQDEPINIKCNELEKKGNKTCGNYACYYSLIKDENGEIKQKGYCKKHLPENNSEYFIVQVDETNKKNYKMNPNNIFPIDMKNLICHNQKKSENTFCGEKAKWYYTQDCKKLGLCTKCKNKTKQECEKIKNTKVTAQDVDKLYLNLMNELDVRPYLLEVDVVLIENQPAFKNPRMKSIQNLIYSYFLLRGIVDKEKTGSKINAVVMLNADKKLMVYDGPEIECHKTSKYEKNKWLSIEYVKYFIDGNNERMEYLLNHKKKDDLCDSFLQGLYYFIKNN